MCDIIDIKRHKDRVAMAELLLKDIGMSNKNSNNNIGNHSGKRPMPNVANRPYQSKHYKRVAMAEKISNDITIETQTDDFQLGG